MELIWSHLGGVQRLDTGLSLTLTCTRYDVTGVLYVFYDFGRVNVYDCTTHRKGFLLRARQAILAS